MTQTRGLVVSSSTPLIPAFALAKGSDEAYFTSLLHRAQRYANVGALIVTLASLAAAPLMCLLILGHVSADVLRFAALLALGWSINIFSLPLYRAAQGQGTLRWNMASHAITGIVVVGVVALLMPLIGSVAVLVGVAAGLIIGSAVTIVGNATAFTVGRAVAYELPTMLAVTGLIGLVCGTLWVGADALSG